MDHTVLNFTNSPAVALLLDDLLAVALPVAGHVLSPLPRHLALAVILHVALHTRHRHQFRPANNREITWTLLITD